MVKRVLPYRSGADVTDVMISQTIAEKMRKCHSKWSENGKSSVGGLLSREEEKEEEEKSDFNPKFKKT